MYHASIRTHFLPFISENKLFSNLEHTTKIVMKGIIITSVIIFMLLDERMLNGILKYLTLVGYFSTKLQKKFYFK